MAFNDPVAFTEESFEELQREFHALRQDATNLRHMLNRVGVRRHQGNQLPPQRFVQVWKDSGSPTVGDILQANADGLHPGRVRMLKGSTWSSGPTIWIKFVDWEADAGAVYAEHGRYVIGIPSGTFTSSSVTRSLYLCETGEQTFVAQIASAQAKGDTGTYKLYHRATEVDSTFTQSAQALGAAIGANKWCTVTRARGGQWYAGCWET